MGLATSALAALTILASAGSAATAPDTAQARACSNKAAARHLRGAELATFQRTCMKGALAPKRPTAFKASSKEARAVTAPSGEDRTVRSKQCSAEADRRRLTDPDRNAFRLSCMATAGPVTEAQTKVQAPKPAPAIAGLGVNRDKPPT